MPKLWEDKNDKQEMRFTFGARIVGYQHQRSIRSQPGEITMSKEKETIGKCEMGYENCDKKGYHIHQYVLRDDIFYFYYALCMGILFIIGSIIFWWLLLTGRL